MIASRWNIVFVHLDPVVGREQAGNRPALILSDDVFNEAMEVVHQLTDEDTRRACQQAVQVHLGFYR